MKRQKNLIQVPIISDFWGVAPFERPSATQITDTQRRRLMLGMTRVVARKGYAETTIADVLVEVRVSRRTFYQLFGDKEDCFLAAYQFAHNSLVSAIENSQRGESDAIRRLEKAHYAYLDVFHRDPDVGAAFLGGIAPAGLRATEQREKAYQHFAEMHTQLHSQCRQQYPELPPVPEGAFYALAGGTNRLVAGEILAGRAANIMNLLPTVLYLSYSVYGMSVEAQRIAELTVQIPSVAP